MECGGKRSATPLLCERESAWMGEMKAAEDSRTLPRPRDCRDRLHATPSARSWSAAVLCRFDSVRWQSDSFQGRSVPPTCVVAPYILPNFPLFRPFPYKLHITN